jgi:hypothetical protein
MHRSKSLLSAMLVILISLNLFYTYKTYGKTLRNQIEFGTLNPQSQKFALYGSDLLAYDYLRQNTPPNASIYAIAPDLI